MHEQALIASWDHNATVWTEAVRAGTIASRVEVTNDAVLQAVRRGGPASVLDLGCGEGWLSRALAQDRVTVVGVDASVALINAARAADPSGDYRVVDYTVPGAVEQALRQRFDCVVANFSLLHEDLAPLLVELRASVLHANGRLVLQTLHPAAVSEPTREGWRTEDFRAFGSARWQPMPWYFRTAASWQRAVIDAGFGAIEVRELKRPAESVPLSLLITAGVASA